MREPLGSYVLFGWDRGLSITDMGVVCGERDEQVMRENPWAPTCSLDGTGGCPSQTWVWCAARGMSR